MTEHVTPQEAPVCASMDPTHAHDHDAIQRLHAWKQEAMLVLAEWEQVWEAMGRPGQLGESKALACARLAATVTEPPDLSHIKPHPMSMTGACADHPFGYPRCCSYHEGWSDALDVAEQHLAPSGDAVLDALPVDGPWAIHKASRTYEGGTYEGISIEKAGVHAGPYATWDEAQEVRTRLDAVNSVGWVIVPYRMPAALRSEEGSTDG